MSHPNYKLTYFGSRGTAETTRFIFAYSAVPYQDVRITSEEWVSLKPKTLFRQLPLLEVDGETFGQSAAINRLLAKKYKLAGTTDAEQAHVDAIVDYQKDIKAGMEVWWYEKDAEKREILRQEYFKTTLVDHFDVLESHLTGYGKGNFFAPSGPTFADFSIACLLFTLEKLYPDCLAKHKLLKAHADRVHNLPGIKEWVEKRPITNT